MEKPTILITDGQSRQALAAVRSLGRAGLHVMIAEREKITLAGCSRFAAKTFVYPDPTEDEDGCVSALETIILAEHVTMVLPMTDRSLIPLAKNAKEFSTTILPFPSLETIMIARDKSHTVDLAKEVGVPTPKTVTIRSLTDLASITTFPVFLKPSMGSGSRGIRIVRSMEEFRTESTTMLREFGTFLAQEIIPREGAEIGCYVLCGPDHRPVASLIQKRLRSFPAHGGPSTLRVTMHDAHILEESVRLLAHIGWLGPAMVEWKVDPRDGIPKLMEINPRFWGSLEGSISAGVDFPLLTYRTFTDNPPSALPSYRDGMLSHWFFPGDLLWFLTSGINWKNLRAFLQSFLVHDDIWSWSDPLPFFGSMVISMLHLFNWKQRAYFLKR